MTQRPEATLETPSEARASAPAGRLFQLDLLRGFVMVVMAIDHVAFFLAKRHPSEMWSVAPTEYPSFIAFFTRAITHLSAPGFFLLMGAGIALFRESRVTLGWSHGRTVRYMTRARGRVEDPARGICH